MNPLKLSDEQIQGIHDYASLLFLPREIAWLIGLSTGQQMAFIDYCLTSEHPYAEAYQKGRLQTEAEIRKTIIDNAIAGSKDAQNLALKYLNDEHFQ